MTKDEMKTLIRSLSADELRTLSSLATYGVDEWDGKTTINGKPFICPGCGGTGLVKVEIGIDQDWAVDEMTLHGDYVCTIPKSRMLDWYGSGELKLECAKCQRDIYIKDLQDIYIKDFEETFVVEE